MENLLSDAEMEAVIDGDHGNVFAVLGIHRDKGSKNVFIRAFQPHAKSIEVIGRDGVSRGMMNRLDERGFFQINLGAGDNFSYRFKIENDRGEFYEAEDTYRFRPTLGDIDVYLLGEGSHLEMYKKLGAHVCEQDGVKGVSFAVWAPNAKRGSVVGNFNNWDLRRVGHFRPRSGRGRSLQIRNQNAAGLYSHQIRPGRLLCRKTSA